MLPELKPGQIYLGGEVKIGDVRTQGGDFIGRDQINNYQINVHVLQGADKRKSYWKDLRNNIRPYLPDRPFNTLEAEIFTGRKAEIENLNQQIEQITVFIQIKLHLYYIHTPIKAAQILF